MKSLIHYLGGFYLSWSHFETMLEMTCMRELGTTPRQNHIIFGSLGFATKLEITISLIQDSSRAGSEKEELISAVRCVPNTARRNHITHSIIATSPDFSLFAFLKRDINNGLKAKHLQFTAGDMAELFRALNDAADRVEQLTGFTAADRQAYVNAAKAAI